MEVIVKLNSQSAGRDKLARFVQYASRFVWNELQNFKTDRYTIDQFKRLESTCSSFRKLLRFGRCFDSAYSIYLLRSYPDICNKIILMLSKLTNSLFLFGDHVVWLARSGFLKNVDSNKWGDISNRWWLITILLNLIRDISECLSYLDFTGVFLFDKTNFANENVLGKSFLILKRSVHALKDRKDILTDTVKNFCDLWIPLTALGRVKLQPGTIGLLGAISSVAAIISLINPETKLAFT